MSSVDIDTSDQPDNYEANQGQSALRAVYRACFAHRKNWFANTSEDTCDYPFDFSCILGSKLCQKSLQRLLKLYDILVRYEHQLKDARCIDSSDHISTFDDLDELHEFLMGSICKIDQSEVI